MQAVQASLRAVVGTSYGRLLSYLAYRFQNLAAAEDALSEAITLALRAWPTSGIPESPEAWLMTVAKRQLLQNARHEQVVHGVADDPVLDIYSRSESVEPEVDDIPDRRLKLLFVCAHPAIDPSLHTALMLQTVLGLDATAIAQAYALPASALAQRLVRAKQKIKVAGLRFEEPDVAELPARLTAVLEAIYAAFSLESSAGEDLSAEAIYLASLVAQLMPEQAEALGLWSLLLSCRARRTAQIGALGEFVPLHEQNTALWDAALIEQANLLIYRAFALRKPGAFQLEAAIQSAHCQRLYTGQVPWAGIVSLYAQLLQVSPTLGCEVAYAAALVESGDTLQAAQVLKQLESIYPFKTLNLHAAYWLTKARLAKAKQAPHSRISHLESAQAALANLPQTKSLGAQIRYIENELVLCKTQDSNS